MSILVKQSAQLLLIPLLCIQFAQADVPRRAMQAALGGPEPDQVCISLHCGVQIGKCLFDKQCRAAVACNAKCQGKRNEQACNLLCELTYGYNSTAYKENMQCMVDHNCIPKSNETDGKCLATDEETLQNVTQMEQVAGRWWILRGLNCGQPGWPAAFDFFPCQYDDFVPGKDGNMGVDHIGYCGGSNNSCSTPMLRTVANWNVTKPGVLSHVYTDPPLKPQDEEWRILSFPHPDWMLYIYCGSTPMGAYGGGSIVSKTATHISEIPKWVETIFRAKAKQHNFDIDTMCISDTSKCEDPFGPGRQSILI
jgi:hypothetical protein